MENIDIFRLGELSREIKTQLEKLGIIVVDESLYTNDQMLPGSVIAVLTCYLPGKALIFAVSIGTWKAMKFTITGELKGGMEEAIKDGSPGPFPKAMRTFTEVEIFEGCEFSINDYISNMVKEGEQIKRGMLFFKNFILNYADAIQMIFTKRSRLWVVPVNSNEFFKISLQEGMDAAFDHFEGIIISKCPEGFFPFQETDLMSA
ncbi:MAG: hypothetical protein WC788_07315 [Candidatus Paceibacterota bacterium]|jgi:hypothetical protein